MTRSTPDERAATGSHRRWILLDTALTSHVGHHRTLAVALRTEARRRGLDLTMVGNAKLDPDLAAGLTALPLFRRSIYDRPILDPIAGGLGAYVDAVPLLSADLRSGVVGAIGADDVVIWPTADAIAISATARWFRDMPPSRRPMVAATFHRIEGMTDASTSPESIPRATLRLSALELGRLVPRERLFVAATTPGLAADVAALIQHAVAVCPVPIPTDSVDRAIPAAAERHVEGRPRIAIPGIPRGDKRAGDLPAALLALVRALPAAPIVVQTDGQGADGVANPPLPTVAGVEVRYGSLADDAYRSLFAEAAIVVMLHGRDAYRQRASGVFVDAVAAGCVPVVAAGTWMADEIAAGHAAGVVYEDATADGIAAAVVAATAGLDLLSAQAAGRIAGWRRRHGIGPWLDQIVAGLGLTGDG